MADLKFTHWNGDLLGLAGGLAVAGMQKFWHDYQQRRSEGWAVTYGQIKRVDVDSEQNRTKLKCYYTYRVAAESFTGSFKKTFRDVDEATTWAEGLDQKQVAVRYDPGNPERSQLLESDLEPVVRAAGAFRAVHPEEGALSAWERLLVTAGLVIATLGVAVSVAMLAGEITGKMLVPSIVATYLGVGGFFVFSIGLWARRDGKRRASTAPSWMKYLGYAIFYYAVFSTVVFPSHPLAPGAVRHHPYFDARYELFLYFSALEWCYARLRAGEDDPHRMPQTV
jgi:Protein of unknown function (DUF3592)